jgi:hypothetical protein
MHAPVTKIIAGTMVIVIKASFHCTASATMNEEKKSDRPVINA